MKKRIFTVCFLSLCFLTGIAQTTKTYTIEINRDDFLFEDKNGYLCITSWELDAIFDSNPNKPAILYTGVNIILPEQEKLKSISLTSGNCTEMTDVILYPSPKLELMGTNEKEIDIPYEIKDYPFELSYSEKNSDGRRYLNVSFNLFAYNAITKTLTWPKELNITIDTEPVEQWEYVSACNWNSMFLYSDLFLNPEDFWNEKKMPSIVGSVWSYVNYETTTDGEEEYNFFRYTVLDEPKELNGHTYYPMVKYTTCEYIPGQEELRVYLREEGCKIYKYLEQEGEETLLYNFAIQPYDKYFEKQHNYFKTVNGKALNISTQEKCFTAEDGFPFRKMTIENMTWIDGIGNVRDFLAEYNTKTGSSVLNYYRSGDGRVVYKNALSDLTSYKTDDCAIGADAIEEKPLPLLEDGKEWIIQTKGNYAYAPVNTICIQIAGDTIVNGRNCKKMHHTFIDEFGNKTHSETYCFQEGDKFYSNEQTVMFDFGLNKGDIFTLSSQNKYIVHQVNDTILNDGVKRKCLTMHRYEDNTFADYWIEGIGSIQMGVYSNDIYKTGAYQKLQSVSENGTNIYQSEANILNTITEAIVNDGKITPEVINETDVATFVVELGVFPGNTSYIQQLDSIVDNTIYTSGIYDGHSREIANFEITHSLPLKTFEKGKYTLIHHINAMNGKAFTDVRKTNVYHFTVGETNEIVQEVCGFSIKMSNMTLTCTSPTAVKMEVYTMDAIKVGESAFANGEAMVKVNKAPSTYLYIVTYPDGRRESGKVVVK